MSRRCCNSTGGWMRVAHLNMADPTHHCPTGFRKIETPLRTCGRPGRGCYATTYSVDGISYSRVCGKIKAYDTAVLARYFRFILLQPCTNYWWRIRWWSQVNSWSKSSQTHYLFWTFANAVHRTPVQRPTLLTLGLYHLLLATTTSVILVAVTILQTSSTARTHYIWDGAGCGGTSTCCQFNNPPWFCKQLPQPTTDDIELRLCAVGLYTNDEDIAIRQVDIFSIGSKLKYYNYKTFVCIVW